MTRYPVYLEIDNDGRCLAHVLELPGCIVRAPSRDEALAWMPDAIRDHHAWLHHHGEAAPLADAAIEVEVAAESTGFGPFERGSRAALFPPDREPVTAEEMEVMFCLLAYSRADLLSLIAALSDDVLDWQPHPGSFSIRGLLRHVGNAEEWYVSRLVPPETLPAEWENDEELHVCEFLTMERRTALERLRQLTEEERSAVIYPTAWTNHPEEPWTARKVLRRFVEHEREHTWQVREILAARRQWLLARLAAERAALWEQLLGLDERTLAQTTIAGDWTLLDLLGHITGWERWIDRTLRAMHAGEDPDFTVLHDLDAANAAFVTAWREHATGATSAAVDEAVTLLLAGRTTLVGWLEALPLEAFFQGRSYEGHNWSFDGIPLRILWEHDEEHAQQIAAWRKTAGLEKATSPKAVLLAALDAAREELLACSALIPVEERASQPLCDAWTLQDVLGHVADWEWLGAEGLEHMAAGREPMVEHVTELDAWNQAHVEARRGQSWETIWDDVHAARRAFRSALERIDQVTLSRKFSTPWGARATPHDWACVYVEHDREHARNLHTWEQEP
jgi:uncharacterized damage-inducible protein DinB/predicted RNase H-like HicB family nuclease